MEKLMVNTPAFLFSALLLILLASAIWVLASVLVDRSLHSAIKENSDFLLLDQIRIIKKRLRMSLAMQVMGVSCMLLCMAFVYFIFMYLYMLAETMLGISFGNGFLSGHFHP